MQPQLRATYAVLIVETGKGASVQLRLQALLAGEAPQRPTPTWPVPLRAARLLDLVAPHVPGALYHPVSKRYTFPLAVHDVLVQRLASPRHLLPPFATLYREQLA